MTQTWLVTLGRVAALTAGMGLLAAAVFVAAREVDLSAWPRLPWWMLPALAATVLGNLFLTALLFHAVTRSFDVDPPVPTRTMVALICASSLLNYLPLKPGMLGRTGYLKLRHGLPLRQSLLIMVVIFCVGGIVLGGTGLLVLLGPPEWRRQMIALAVLLLLILSPLVSWLAPRLLGRSVKAAWLWIPLRVADMLVGGVKLWLAFAAVGQSVGLPEAVAIRAAGSLIDMFGVTPNGLGLREWTQAGLAALCHASSGGAALTASVMERGVEAMVTVVVGTTSILFLRLGGSRPLAENSDQLAS